MILVLAQLSLARPGFSDARTLKGVEPYKVRVLENSSDKIVFEVEFEAETLGTWGGRLHFAEYPGRPGEPGLPVYRFKVAIPRGTEPRVSVEVLETQGFYGKPPAPRPRLAEDGLSLLYQEDPVAYSQAQRLWEAGEPKLFRHVKYFTLALRPVSYAAGRYSLAKRIRVEINLSPTEDGLEPFWGPDPFDAVYPSLFVNWEGQASWKAQRPKGKASDPWTQALLWVKVPVLRDGIYEITYEDLLSAGVPQALLGDPNALAVFTVGPDTFPSKLDFADLEFHQVARVVDDGGDGVFGPGDRVLFYAQGMPTRLWDSTGFRFFQNPYTDTVVYWLAVGFSGAPLESYRVDASPKGYPPLDWHNSFGHHERDLFVPGKKGLVWVGEVMELPVSANEAPYDFTLNLPDALEGEEGWVEVSIAGAETYGTVYFDVYLNGQFLGRERAVESTRRVYKFPAWSFKAGKNTVRITLVRSDTLRHEVYLDYIDVRYKRKNRFSGELHLWWGFGADTGSPYPQGKYDIALEGSRPVFAWDVSDPAQPKLLKGFSWTSGKAILSDSVYPGKHIYLATFTRKPPYLRVVSFARNLRDTTLGADYIALGPKALKEPARALVDWRRERLLRFQEADSSWELGPGRVVYVSLEEIYLQFGFGMPDPVAIRNFLYYAFRFWQKPEPTYAIFLGDGTYDYRDLLGAGGNLFPPWEPFESFSLNDNWSSLDAFYVDFTEDGYEDIFFGRVPARDGAELWNYVRLVKAYERGEAFGPWRMRALLVADDEYTDYGNTDYYHTQYMNLFQEQVLPRHVEARHVYEIEYPMEGGMKPKATADFLNYFNQGSGLLVFFGHGSPVQLTHERLYLHTRDKDLVSTGLRTPFIWIFSCKVGVYDRLDPPHAIGEDWALRASVGVITTPAKSTGGSNNSYMRAMAQYLFSQGLAPAGAVELQGKNNATYMLFGDPALAVSFPLPTMTLEADTLYPGARARARGAGARTGRVFVAAYGPRYEKWVVTERGDTIRFQSEDWPQFVGSVPAADSFSFSWFVPWSERQGLGARVVAWEPGRAGLADSLFVGEPQPSQDITGPRVEFWAEGRQVADGDTLPLKFRLTVRLSDSSGIYIRPKEDPNTSGPIILAIDERQFIDVTTLFTYDEGSDTSGFLVYELDFAQEPGAHSLAVRAYDNAGNLSSKQVQVYAVQEALSLGDVLPVPNPWRGSGPLYITYRVNVQARVRAKVYSVGGKLVWQSPWRSVGPGLGFFSWLPPESLANGLYLLVVEAQEPGSKKKVKAFEKVLIVR